MSGTSGGLPPWSLAVVAMLSVQLGAALSVDLIATVGPAGTAWLRLTAGALIFLALARPRFRDIARRDYPALLAVQSGTRRALLWPILALLGVVLLTEPWQGTVNVVGIGFAVLSAVGWGGYIVLTQHVGDRFDGVTGLAVTIPVAALTTAAVGIPQASGHITVGVIVASIGLALLYPVVPFALEMLALGRMTHTAFGTLMALEPAIATALGLVVLHQKPSAVQLCGILLVVVSGAAAQRGGGRQRPAAVALPYPPQ